MHRAIDHRGHALGHVLHGVEHAHVVRDRVEAAGVDDPGPGGDGRVVVLEVHAVDELGLAGQVHVVGAYLGAGGHEGLAVFEVGADGGDDDAGRQRHLDQRPRILGVRDHDARSGDVRHLGRQAGDEGVQLGPVAPGHGPRAALGQVPHQVLGHQAPGETGRAIEDDVERAIGLVGRGRGLVAGFAHSTVVPHTATPAARSPAAPRQTSLRRPSHSLTQPENAFPSALLGWIGRPFVKAGPYTA